MAQWAVTDGPQVAAHSNLYPLRRHEENNDTEKFQTLKLDEIIPYENNPRINDEAVADVIASIEQCENLDPIEIDEENVILSGHTRLKALYELGYEETEVVRYTGLTEEQKRKYRLLANKTAEKASWDFGKLEMELDGLDFKGFDFGLGENESFYEALEDDFGIAGNIADSDFTNITFSFLKEQAKDIKEFIKEHSKEELTAMIYDCVRGYNA